MSRDGGRDRSPWGKCRGRRFIGGDDRRETMSSRKDVDGTGGLKDYHRCSDTDEGGGGGRLSKGRLEELSVMGSPSSGR